MKRESFVFYRSWREAIKNLTREMQGEVLTAIIEYGLDGVTTESLKPITSALLTIAKPQIDMQGKRGGFKGAESDERKLIRNSPSMKAWRKAVFERDSYKCQKCGKIGGKLNAHHIKPFSLYPDLRFDIDNGITLCKECHIELHKTEREWEGK